MTTARKTASKTAPLKGDNTRDLPGFEPGQGAAQETEPVKTVAEREHERHAERLSIGLELQRLALRLGELGCMRSSASVLTCAVRLAKLRPGKVA